MRHINFSPSKEIPSLEGKIVLITGGNSGLGKQSVLELAKHKPSEIWIGARSTTKAQEAISQIKQQVPNTPPIKVLEMDLASFTSIRQAARAFCQQSQRLDILMLNAGIMMVPKDTSKDGYEIQFGTNHMGHALLTKLLLPKLLETTQIPGADVRVTVLSSSAHSWADKSSGIVFDMLKTKGENLSTSTLYGQSKLANILWTRELARRYPQIKASSVNPGVVDTNLNSSFEDSGLLMGIVYKLAIATIAVDMRTGVLNQLWASVAPNVMSGQYYEPIGVAGKGSKWSKNKRLAEVLWDWTEKELEGENL